MKLREEDRREFEVSSGEVGNHPVLRAAIMSQECIVGLDDEGEVLSLWGVVAFKDFGAIWGCGSKDCMRVIKQLTDDVQPYLSRWQDQFGVIGGVIDSRNTKHVRWLRRLGFTIYENSSFIKDVPFHFFRRADV